MADSDPEEPVEDGSGASTGPLPLPPSFLGFLDSNHINPKVYELCGSLPRFVRVKADSKLTIDDLRKEFPDAEVEAVSYLPSFFKLSGETPLASSELYRQGKLFGIDISSGVAVAALGLQPGDHCLDLCAAPGAKLCMLADLCGEEGTVTGVDVSEQRLTSCKGVVKKYGYDNVRLFLGDGTRFATFAPIRMEEELPFITNKKLRKKRKRGHSSPSPLEEPRLFYQRKNCFAESQNLYDRVLVDAECTHDGSLRHILKYNQWGWGSFEKKFMDPSRLSTLEALQRGLIATGFRLLKPGGVLVYSTCSFAKQQNEDIVAWLLQQQGDEALLEPVDPGLLPDLSCYSSHARGMVRFDPAQHGTSGLFVAKITKRRAEAEPTGAGKEGCEDERERRD